MVPEIKGLEVGDEATVLEKLVVVDDSVNQLLLLETVVNQVHTTRINYWPTIHQQARQGSPPIPWNPSLYPFTTRKYLGWLEVRVAGQDIPAFLDARQA